MAQQRTHTTLWFLGSLVTAATVGAHVRLVYQANGAPLYWSNPGSLSLVINSDGSDDINDGSEATAIRNASSGMACAPARTARCATTVRTMPFPSGPLMSSCRR